MTTKVTIEVELPDDPKMVYWLLDWLKTFDKTHEGCVFRIKAIDGSNMTMGEAWKMLELVGLTPFYSERKR